MFPCGLGAKNEERESKMAPIKELGGGGEERKEAFLLEWEGGNTPYISYIGMCHPFG